MLDFIALAQECAPSVVPQTLAAIVKTESGFKPFSIGVNGGVRLVRQPESKAEALVTAKWLIENGYNIDLGLGQINSTNLTRLGLSIDDSFDPCKNVGAAAKILHANFQIAKSRGHNDHEALHAAISAYNTGSFSKGFSNGYVQKVINNAGSGVTNFRKIVPIPLTVKKPIAKLKAASTDSYSNTTYSLMVY